MKRPSKPPTSETTAAKNPGKSGRNPGTVSTLNQAGVVGVKRKPRPPTKYTEGLAQNICELIASGSNLTRMSKMPGMPAFKVVASWLRKYAETFGKDYAHAREARADSRADRIDEIGARLERGEIDAATARVLIDAEKWQAGKEKPWRYGDRLDQNITIDPGPKTLESLRERALAIGSIFARNRGIGTTPEIEAESAE